jgi:predicted nucleotide-binding protein (sugar kinase/HSP70/actin superfamily)
MEQITAFVLGVFIVTLVMGFVSMFRASKTVKANKESIDDLHNKIDELCQWATQTNNDTYSSIDRVEGELHREIDNIHRITDSRVDKLDARFQHQIDDLARELDTCMNTGNTPEIHRKNK